MNWIWKLPLNLISQSSNKYQLDPLLLAAIISVESSGDPLASRYEKSYNYLVDTKLHARKNNITHETEEILQKTSHGLVQIMGGTARFLGFQGSLVKLYRPNININYGAMYISKLKEKYDKLEDVIAAYNAGSAKMINGEYANQNYVDKVLDRMGLINAMGE